MLDARARIAILTTTKRETTQIIRGKNMEPIINKISKLSVESIKEIIVKAMDDHREEMSVVLDAAMCVLEQKIGTDKFAEFADAI